MITNQTDQSQIVNDPLLGSIEFYHPSYRYALEAKERFARYNIMSFPNFQSEGYSLKYVKLSKEIVDQNPVFQVAHDRKEKEQNPTEVSI